MTTLPIDTSARDTFLALIDPRQRGIITNLFLAGPRSGITDPDAIVEHVLDILAERIERGYESGVKAEALALIVRGYPAQALAFARYCVEYVALPQAQRSAIKETRATAAVSEWMRNHPPTEKQVAYLRRLGHVGYVENREHASQLIERLQRVKGVKGVAR